ncbi:MAG: SprT family zinc-dependent metalloprotease [Gallionella sp.]
MLKRLRNLVVPPSIEQRAALLEGKHITYTLKRSTKRRSIGLHIDERGLIVSVPMRSSEKWLHSVLQEKARWVVKSLDGWRQANIPAETRWADGETIPYLGELLSLRVVPSLFVTPTYRKDKQLWVYVNNSSEPACIEEAACNWYRHEAKRLFLERVEYYAPMMNVSPSAVKLSSAKTQWGCCTAEGVVRLNLQLIKLPLRLIDYVVVHELAHLREMNHSTKFWDVVEMACADYVGLRNELKRIFLGNI